MKTYRALGALLTDEKMSHYARFASQGNPASEAGEAFRSALEKTSGPLKVGIINSLGARRDEKAVAALAGLVTDANRDVAVAALDALGVGLPRDMLGTERYYTSWMDTQESNDILHFQQHSFSTYQQDLQNNLRRIRPLLRPLAPIAHWLLRKLLA